MMSLVNRVRNSDVSRISVLVLVMCSPQDHVVDPMRIINTVATFDQNMTTMVSVEEPDDPARQVLAGDILSPSTTSLVVDTIEDFVNEISIR